MSPAPICACGHDHSDQYPDQSLGVDIFSKIDIEKVICLNEKICGSGRDIIMPICKWDRLTIDNESKNLTSVSSDLDNDLMFQIPFFETVKVRSILLYESELQFRPKTMKIFKNRPGLSFDEVGFGAEQEINLPLRYNRYINIPIKTARFSNVNHLTLYFVDSIDREQICLEFIGFLGEEMNVSRTGIAVTNYEVTPNLADHDLRFLEKNARLI
ncbi:hypothetical protein GJ496_006016 [Pomphorhynchus laevis]|nr:hypothetical protein GJ496_006016 [Pomphorhynchus laevis]